VALLLGLVLLLPAYSPGAEPEPVVVALKPSVKARTRLLSVGDVADLYGGNAGLSQRIARLDISDNRDGGTSSEISQRQIRIRLLLAGIPADSFSFVGAESVVVVQQTDPINDQLITDSIRSALAGRHQVPTADLEVRVAQPLPAVPEAADVSPDEIRIEPYLPDSLPRGRTRMRVAVHVKGRLRTDLPVTVDVTEYQHIAVATRLITRGQLLTDGDLKSERRPITGPVQYVSLANAVGREAKRSFRPGEPIRTYDVQDTREESPILVKYRDTVRLVARKGQLTVTLSAAEALQQGRLGDVVRVRNVVSKRVIVGKVVGPGELEVRF